MQTKSKNHETCRGVVLSHVEAVVKIVKVSSKLWRRMPKTQTSPWASTRQNMFLKNKKICRVPGAITRQNKFLKIKKNSECHPLGTRQNLTAGGHRHVPATFCWVGLLPSAAALGKAQICREPGFAECLALSKAIFAKCFILSSAALDKIFLCRVPR